MDNSDNLPTGILYFYSPENQNGKRNVYANIQDADGVQAIIIFDNLTSENYIDGTLIVELDDGDVYTGCTESFGFIACETNKPFNPTSFMFMKHQDTFDFYCSEESNVCTDKKIGIILIDNLENQYHYVLDKSNNFYYDISEPEKLSPFSELTNLCQCTVIDENYCYIPEGTTNTQGTCSDTQLECADNVCTLKVVQCTSENQDSSCAVNQLCTGSICMNTCSAETICPQGFTCTNEGHCIMEGQTCTSDAHCLGSKCQNNICQVINTADGGSNAANNSENTSDSNTGNSDGPGNSGSPGSHYGGRDCTPVYPQSCYDDIKKEQCINGQRSIFCQPLNGCLGTSKLVQTCGSGFATSCTDHVKNQGETGVDCGGPCSKKCSKIKIKTDAVKQPVLGDQPELSEIIGDPQVYCFDGTQNYGEYGIDCGGSCNAVCQTCFDDIQNQNEEGVDCGGSCQACNMSTISKLALWIIPFVLIIGLLMIVVLSVIHHKSGGNEGLGTSNKLTHQTMHSEHHNVMDKTEQKKLANQLEADIPDISTSNKHFDSQLKHYIEVELDKGYNKEHIIDNLTSVGWSKERLENLFENEANTFLPQKYKQHLKRYVHYYKQKGMTIAQIEKKLLDGGWNKNVIKEFLK